MERFEGGAKNREIAAVLRVSERSVERRRRQWREVGASGVRRSPGGPVGRSRLCRGAEARRRLGASRSWVS
ncbi:helix-turn-helix domain-containing protein [Streptomyces sp. NPDC058548]|uniref:helix-turn-helix domain-containing protein n=1 Tax=Streptomyces sp. NPDC058548 TaxID=3346545 RepID=UPI00366671D2